MLHFQEQLGHGLVFAGTRFLVSSRSLLHIASILEASYSSIFSPDYVGNYSFYVLNLISNAPLILRSHSAGKVVGFCGSMS